LKGLIKVSLKDVQIFNLPLKNPFFETKQDWYLTGFMTATAEFKQLWIYFVFVKFLREKLILRPSQTYNVYITITCTLKLLQFYFKFQLLAQKLLMPCPHERKKHAIVFCKTHDFCKNTGFSVLFGLKNCVFLFKKLCVFFKKHVFSLKNACFSKNRTMFSSGVDEALLYYL